MYYPTQDVHQHVCTLSCVWLFVTPWTVALQDPLFVGFSRQELWAGLSFRSPGNLPDPGIEPTSLTSLALAGRIFTIWATRKPKVQETKAFLFSRRQGTRRGFYVREFPHRALVGFGLPFLWYCSILRGPQVSQKGNRGFLVERLITDWAREFSLRGTRFQVFL